MSSAEPHFEGVTGAAAESSVDMLFVPVFQEDTDLALSAVPGLEEASGGWISGSRSRGEFRGKLYEFFIVRLNGGWKAARVALIGAGRRADATPERLRLLAAACGYTARLRAVPTVGFLVREGLDPIVAAAAAADGLSAAEFDSGSYKADQSSEGKYSSKFVVIAPGADPRALADAVTRGRLIGVAANQARVLANEPGNVLTPREFAARVAAMGNAAGLQVDVLDETRMRELKMGLLLGVAQGSAEPPRMVVLRYEPAGAPKDGPCIGLVGKGVTFDTGGISIKPAEGMDRMKDDMSGGAAVASAICAIAALGGPHRVMGVIPMVENMPGGRAIRPGDVLTAASGTTVEITNTDAEGRLILADALWYAQQLGATHLMDVATLTGACMVALGKTAAGLMGSPDAWVETIRGVAARAGDRIWPLPLYDEYREQLKSEIADTVNAAGRGAGAITAAWFLKCFIENDRPWAHLDIAGTAWSEERKAYQPKGATGSAVRTLIELGLSGGAGPAAGSQRH
jgi:leucyl aminopeptidase